MNKNTLAIWISVFILLFSGLPLSAGAENDELETLVITADGKQLPIEDFFVTKDENEKDKRDSLRRGQQRIFELWFPNASEKEKPDRGSSHRRKKN